MGNCCCREPVKIDDHGNQKIDFSSGKVHVVTSKEDWDAKISEANKEGMIVVVNFIASWCGPSHTMAPIYSDLSIKYSALTFLTVDIDKLAEFSSTWDIRATPTFFFLKDGEQIDQLVGSQESELEKRVVAFANMSTRSTQ